VLDLGADADDAALVQVAQRMLADVGNVARDFFRSQLRIAGFNLELFDVDAGVVILADEFLADEDRVFEVVTAPGHEGHEYVTSKRQLALLGARSVGDDLALDHAVALADNRLLIDAGVLVGALELDELVDVRTHLARQLRGWCSPSTRTMMRSESTESTMPLRLARMTAPESRAVTPSMPVPTRGASATSRGTDWRCMLAPIRARLASSCSRNGTSEAATETSCLGLTSM